MPKDNLKFKPKRIWPTLRKLSVRARESLLCKKLDRLVQAAERCGKKTAARAMMMSKADETRELLREIEGDGPTCGLQN